SVVSNWPAVTPSAMSSPSRCLSAAICRLTSAARPARCRKALQASSHSRLTPSRSWPIRLASGSQPVHRGGPVRGGRVALGGLGADRGPEGGDHELVDGLEVADQ